MSPLPEPDPDTVVKHRASRPRGIDPAPGRSATTWTGFLRSQAAAILSCDFVETLTLTGGHQYIVAGRNVGAGWSVGDSCRTVHGPVPLFRPVT